MPKLLILWHNDEMDLIDDWQLPVGTTREAFAPGRTVVVTKHGREMSINTNWVKGVVIGDDSVSLDKDSE